MADFNNLLNEIDEEPLAIRPTEEDDQEEEEVLESDLIDIDQQAEEVNITIPANDLTVARQTQPSSFQTLDGNEIYEDELFTDDDYMKLKTLWIRELNTTELLPYDNETMSYFMDALPEQESALEELQDQANSSLYNVDPSLASLATTICKMDMDRVTFLLTDLIRTRLRKIEKYALHNREEQVLIRMSNDEISYLKSYGELFEKHMRRTVTDHLLKESWKRLDEPEMIDRPNLNTYVFCRVSASEGIYEDEMDRNADERGDDNEEDNDDERTLHAKDACLFVRYGAIRQMVLEGKVELVM